MLSIKKIQDMRTNKRKGFSFMEILVALIMIVSLSVGAFFTYSDAQQTRKMAQMHSDMDAIVTGLLVYEALHDQSTLPENLTDLVDGIDADDAVDFQDHKNIVTSVKATDGNFVDPWGNAYIYVKADRTLKCVPVGTDQVSLGEDKAVVRQF